VKIADDDQDTEPNHNRQTLMDYVPKYAGSFTDQQKGYMKTSLAIGNWDVKLSSSSQTVTSIGLSYTKEAPSKQFGKIMGVRIHFPLEPFNSWATIKPPFEIPAFEPQATISDDGTIEKPADNNDGITRPSRFEAPANDEGKVDNTKPAYGVVKNVGTIKKVHVYAYGLNFPHQLYTDLIDSTGVHKEVKMGDLNYDGWGELVWENPAYIQEVRNRDLRLYPLYPFSTPFIKFGGFRVARDASKQGGDFIIYFKDVKIIYDKAVLDTDRDIDDEALWGIINVRETARKTWEMERFGQNQVLHYLDQQKRATENDFTPSAGQQEQQ
jgi:hypothetical protein